MSFIVSAFADEIDDMLDIQMQTIKKYGLNHIEMRGVDEKNIFNYTTDEIKIIKNRLDAQNIKISALGSPAGKINITDNFDEHLEQFKNAIELSKILETKYIRMFSFFIPEGEDPAKYRDEVLRRIDLFVKAANGSGITLLHENEKGIYGDNAERCYDILSSIGNDNLKATFDPANFVQCGVETLRAFEILRPYIKYMHIKDALSDGSVVPAGDGNGHVREILSMLKTDGFDGFLSLEPHLGNFSGLASLEQNSDYSNLPIAGERTFKLAYNALDKIISDLRGSNIKGEITVNIPELLTSVSGYKITDKTNWEKFRRPEIMNLLTENIFGVQPVERPSDLRFNQLSINEDFRGSMIYKDIEMSYGNEKSKIMLFLPKKLKPPFPAFVYPLLAGQETKYNILSDTDIPILPLEYITSQGYAVAVLPVSSIDPDKCGARTTGVRAEFGENDRPNSWGTISAWAWGMSRVMDYLSEDDCIDEKRVVAVGHSRGGKTALWCGATDTRFASVIANCSGSTGASLARGNTGETIEDINRIFPYWFCENYKKFGKNVEMLPLDQHMLLAMLAPRPLYISSATDDDWACPKNELRAARLASEAYQLYNKNGLVADEEIEFNKPYHDGELGYHIKSGSHSITQDDWKYFIDFTNKKIIK